MKHNVVCKIKILGNIEAFGVKMGVHLHGWMDGCMDGCVDGKRMRETERGAFFEYQNILAVINMLKYEKNVPLN